MNQHLKLGTGRIVGKYSARGKGGKWFAEIDEGGKVFREILAECHRVLRDARHIYLMSDSASYPTLHRQISKLFKVKDLLVWDKVNLAMGRYFRRRHELILFASKGRRRLSSQALQDIWRIKKVPGKPYRTRKPVELFREMIVASRHQGDRRFVVCDPFVGSGSSAIAALREEVTFIGCDLSGEAIDLARGRIKEFAATGRDPLEPKTGRTTPGFTWIAQERIRRRHVTRLGGAP